METKKIVMTSTFYPPYHIGGDAVHVKYLAEELVRQGHEVHVLHSEDAYRFKGGKVGGVETGGIHAHRLRTTFGGAAPPLTYMTGRSGAAERTLMEIVAETKPDWVHHHNISLLGIGILSIGTCPKLYTAHDYWLVCPRSDMLFAGNDPCRELRCVRCTLSSMRPPQLWRGGFGRRLKGVSKFIAPSRFSSEILRRFAGIEAVVIPNFAPRVEAGGNKDQKEGHFIFSSVLERHKGLEPLLETFSSGEIGPELHVAGRGSLEHLVRRREKETDGHVTYLGYLDRSELISEMRSALAMVLPSICYENAPLSCIEGLSLGLPLVVSTMGGLPELIEEPRCGIACEPTVAGISGALRQIEDDDRLRSTFSSNALRRYESFHTPERYIESYMGTVEEVL